MEHAAPLESPMEPIAVRHARDLESPAREWLQRLMDTRLTDDGLARLKALPKLERLDLEGSKVTDEGIAAFLRSRPDVRVFH